MQWGDAGEAHGRYRGGTREIQGRYRERARADGRYRERARADGRYRERARADGRYRERARADGRYRERARADLQPILWLLGRRRDHLLHEEHQHAVEEPLDQLGRLLERGEHADVLGGDGRKSGLGLVERGLGGG
jgi:hypothetical protein